VDIKADLFESGFEVFDDFLSETVRAEKVVGLFEGFVSATEDVEAGFIAIEKLLGLEKIRVLFSSLHAKAGLLFCSTTGPSRIDIGLQGIDNEIACLRS
jgi:hypothetical protein